MPDTQTDIPINYSNLSESITLPFGFGESTKLTYSNTNTGQPAGFQTSIRLCRVPYAD